MGKEKQRTNIAKERLRAETAVGARYAKRVRDMELARDAAVRAGTEGAAALQAASAKVADLAAWGTQVREQSDVVVLYADGVLGALRQAQEQIAATAVRQTQALDAAHRELTQRVRQLVAATQECPALPQIDPQAQILLETIYAERDDARAQRDQLLVDMQRLAPVVTTARKIVAYTRQHNAEMLRKIEATPGEPGTEETPDDHEDTEESD